MNRKFTLIELVITITVLGILLAIILINFADLKKKSITSAMNQNISIIQSEVDTYFIKKEEYPILSQKSLRLENPQLIDFEKLVQNGFQKKKLDTSKIKNQYYWVDVFGKVWGSTQNNLDGINLMKQEEGLVLEGHLGEEAKGYNVYEVRGYFTSNSSLNSLTANLNKNSKSYKVIEEYEVNKNEEVYIQHAFKNEKDTYLFSSIDEYGLESAPKGKFSDELQFSPIIRGEGEYEFEIAGSDMMYWIDFITLEDTPGDSKIDYLFTVQDSDGNYLEQWTDDYFSLDPSKGIKVKVIMKGDDKGNKPSLYDLRIIFKYEDEEVPTVLPSDVVENKEETLLCPENPFKSDFNAYSNALIANETGKMSVLFKLEDLISLEDALIPTVSLGNNVKFKIIDKEFYIEENNTYSPYVKQKTNGKCIVVVYEIEILSFKKPVTDNRQLCGENGTPNRYNYTENGRVMNQVVYSTYLEKNEFLTKINKPITPSESNLKHMFVEVSYKGAPFERVDSISKIKDESCVNFIYVYEGLLGFPPAPPMDMCKEMNCQPTNCGSDCVIVSKCGEDCIPEDKDNTFCDENPTNLNCQPYCVQYQDKCIPNPCGENCSSTPPTGPAVGDKELEDLEWKTVDRLRFFGHGAQNQLTRWYKSEHRDSIVEMVNSDEISLGDNTRIVYRYAKSNGTYWSGEYKDFTMTDAATSVMAIAYIQVRISKQDQVSESDYPTVKSMRFYNEKGYLDMSMLQPTLTILAKKDNNGTRNVYSDESNIEWLYEAADPRNKKITDIQWRGVKQSKYAVGEYLIEARVKNDVEIWSEWTSFKLEVLQEKPIANMMVKVNGISQYPTDKDTISFSLADSIDPDGDKIVNSEWDNKKNQYTVGDHIVKVRVQDEEGYWSDWKEQKLTIYKNALKVLRIEGESQDKKEVPSNMGVLVSDSTYNKGGGVFIKGAAPSLTIEFEGNGFDIKVASGTMRVNIDGKGYEYIQEGITPYRNLAEGKHTLVIASEGVLDYVDIYSLSDLVTITDNKFKVINSAGVESAFENNVFSSELDEKIKFYYRVDKNNTEKVKVLDSSGKEVRVIKTSTHADSDPRNKFVIWDGLDSKGNTLKNGVYSLVFEHTGVNGGKVSSKYDVQLKNLIPTLRIEAESNDPAEIVSRVATILTDENLYSNGQATSIRGATNSVDFTFDGTGFDIKVIEGTLRVLIDGQREVYMSQGVNTIRDLPNGKHVVRILATGVVDYIDTYGNTDKVSISNTSFKFVNDKNTLSVFPKNNFASNVGEKARLYYTIDKNNEEEISVYDSNNKFVTQLRKVNHKEGTTRHKYVDWNGLDSKGNTANNGTYYITVKMTGVYGTETIEKYGVELRNNKSSYRIEAESDNPSEISGRLATIVDDANLYSNGKAVSLSGAVQSVDFSFTGTGFDLKVTSGNVRMSINGASYVYVGEGTISIRDLPNQKHMIRMASQGIVDYMEVYTD